MILINDTILILYHSKTKTIVRGSIRKLSKTTIEKESKDDIIKNIRNLFKLKIEN